MSLRHLVAALVMAATAATMATAVPAGARSGPSVVPPDGHGWIGSFVNHDDPETDAARMAGIDAVERALGRTLDIAHHYRAFRDPVIGVLEEWDRDRGRVPLVSWHGARTDRVAAGEFDQLVDEQARLVRDFGHPVLLRWGWEMNMTGRWWVTDADDYIAAWRRIVGRFRDLGVDNVDFVWCPTASAFREGTADAWYPGDDWVDWLCADGYNWAATPGPGWRSFQRIFEDFHAWGADRGKPLMVGEVGVQDDGVGSKADWLRAADDTLQRSMPEVRALVYFDSLARYDWRTQPQDGKAFQAWRDLVRTPYWWTGRDAPPAAGEVTMPQRVTGDDATTGSLAVSQMRFDAGQATRVLLSRDDRFPDALAAAALADSGPLLFTPTTHLAEEVAAEIDRVLVPGGRVHVLGGPDALAAPVVDELRHRGHDVVRLAGEDRIATSIAIAEEVRRLHPAVSQAGVARSTGASGDDPSAWADAVSGGAWAAGHGVPLLLTASDELDPRVAAWLDVHRPARTTVFGGEDALSSRVAADIRGARRVGGSDRGETSALVASELWDHPAGHVVVDGYVEDGWAWGLAAAGLSADERMPVLLVDGPDAGSAVRAQACSTAGPLIVVGARHLEGIACR